MSRQKIIEDAIKVILIAIGDDPDREGLLDTPRRVAKMYLNELTTGIGANLEDELSTTFEEGHSELVIVKDIPFYSLCEHHLMVFSGRAHIGYIPDGKIVGISKLARLVKVAAATLSVQERLTSQIADTIDKVLTPSGIIVVMEAEHLCMAARGVNTPGTKTITSAVRGIFHNDSSARAEFLSLIK